MVFCAVSVNMGRIGQHVLLLYSGLLEDCIQHSFGQVGSAVNWDGNRPASFPYHDVMIAGNAIKAPAICFQQFFELFGGHEVLYTAYKVYVKQEQSGLQCWCKYFTPAQNIKRRILMFCRMPMPTMEMIMEVPP